jgi:hypothetical protein
VHGEQLVVELGAHQPQPGARELQPHRQRKDAAQKKEHEGRDDEAPRNGLVVDRAQAAEPSRRIAPGGAQGFVHLGIGLRSVQKRRGGGAHRRPCR